MGMTLLKAAEILELNIKEAGSKIPPDVKEAVIYGKEAIERIDYGRKSGSLWAQKLLPSEISGVRR